MIGDFFGFDVLVLVEFSKGNVLLVFVEVVRDGSIVWVYFLLDF